MQKTSVKHLLSCGPSYNPDPVPKDNPLPFDSAINGLSPNRSGNFLGLTLFFICFFFLGLTLQFWKPSALLGQCPCHTSSDVFLMLSLIKSVFYVLIWQCLPARIQRQAENVQCSEEHKGAKRRRGDHRGGGGQGGWKRNRRKICCTRRSPPAGVCLTQSPFSWAFHQFKLASPGRWVKALSKVYSACLETEL